MKDHTVATAAASFLLVAAIVSCCIGIRMYFNPSIDAQYYARCVSGNYCKVGR